MLKLIIKLSVFLFYHLNFKLEIIAITETDKVFIVLSYMWACVNTTTKIKIKKNNLLSFVISYCNSLTFMNCFQINCNFL